MASTYIVYLNDGRIIGPFDDGFHAEDWAKTVPNILFRDAEQYDHADTNSDFWTAEVEAPPVERVRPGVTYWVREIFGGMVVAGLPWFDEHGQVGFWEVPGTQRQPDEVEVIAEIGRGP